MCSELEFWHTPFSAQHSFWAPSEYLWTWNFCWKQIRAHILKGAIAFLIAKEKIITNTSHCGYHLNQWQKPTEFCLSHRARIPSELASIGEKSTSAAVWLKASHAFSSVGVMVKINWFWNVHVHFSTGTPVITPFDKRGNIPKLLPCMMPVACCSV